MIARHWKGVSFSDKSDEYILHLKEDTFKALEQIEGFVSARILLRELSDGTEFQIITHWDSLEAIKQFAGEKFDTAVVPESVRKMMLRFDAHVDHYEVAYEK